MSFKKNKNQQLNIFDSYLNQSDRVKKMIKKSWCHYFSEIVFPAINEERFSVLYSGNQASRPNTPVYTGKFHNRWTDIERDQRIER